MALLRLDDEFKLDLRISLCRVIKTEVYKLLADRLYKEILQEASEEIYADSNSLMKFLFNKKACRREAKEKYPEWKHVLLGFRFGDECLRKVEGKKFVELELLKGAYEASLKVDKIVHLCVISGWKGEIFVDKEELEGVLFLQENKEALLNLLRTA